MSALSSAIADRMLHTPIRGCLRWLLDVAERVVAPATAPGRSRPGPVRRPPHCEGADLLACTQPLPKRTAGKAPAALRVPEKPPASSVRRAVAAGAEVVVRAASGGR